MDKSSKQHSFWIFIAAGIISGIAIKLFVFDILHISGHSMEPTLRNNDSVSVFKMAYGVPIPWSKSLIVNWAEPKRNDIVIFLHGNKIVVKRCIGIAGDHLDFLMDSQYILKVNQLEVPLTPSQYNTMKSFGEVPQGYVLVLGDNLEDSIDSRDYGFVSVKNITGKIIGR